MKNLEFKEKDFFINYDIDDKGTVKNKLTGKNLKTRIANKTGYLVIGIRINQKSIKFSIHRLIAFKYIPFLDGKFYINHKDGNKLNNDISNLEWCTASENLKHAYDSGLHAPCYNMLGRFGKDHNLSKAVHQLDKYGNLIKEHESISAAAISVNGNPANISSCCLNRYGFKSASGYKWRYAKS